MALYRLYTISHNKLISKLERYNMRDKELDWFKSICSTDEFELIKMEVYLKKNRFILVFHNGRSWDLCYLYCSSMTYEAIFKYSKILKYADDLVIFCENGRLPTIKHQLDEDLKNLSRWFKENKLLINLKPGKTKMLLFGTSQCIAKTNKNFKVKCNNQYINKTVINTVV